MNVFLFCGQSSRHPGMFEWLERDYPAVYKTVKDRADAVLGTRWLPDFSVDAPFVNNRSIQLAVFVANHMHLEVLHAEGVRARHSAGLSLGEYNHLVHIGALEFEDALRLVDARGRSYDAGPTGSMAAVFPTSEDELVPIVDRVAQRFEVAISNYNSPSQFVVAGETDGIGELVRLVEDETFAQARIIEHRVPMHCEYFRPAATALGKALRSTVFREARGSYVPNVSPTPIPDASRQDFIEFLTRHVYEPVRFRESVDLFVETVQEPTFIEVGPRHIITDLLHRRWCRRPKFSTHDRASVEAIVASES